MTETGFDPDFPLLIWLAAVVVVTLTLHVVLGWLRQAQREHALRRQVRSVLMASAVLATGLCGTAVLALAGEDLPFAVGFRASYAMLLWLGAFVAAVPTCWLLRSAPWWALLLGSMMMATLAAALHIGWFTAAGFRPGIVWNPDHVAQAVAVMAAGCSAGLLLGFSNVSQEGHYRVLWRAAASSFVGLVVLGGLQFLTESARLGLQVGSVYGKEMPMSVLSLLCAGLLPLLLGVLAFDLVLRKRPRRGPGTESRTRFDPSKRRKRRLRTRWL